jgi:diguanylate cyclase (GGDEF)-like protein
MSELSRSYVLLIEDNPRDTHLVKLMLSTLAGDDLELSCVSTLAEAATRCRDTKHDVALLDMSLSDVEGLDGINLLKTQLPGMPIVVMSDRKDEDFALQTVKQGAQDCLVKGEFDSWQLIRTLRHSIERKRLVDEMTHMAHHDQLTHLANRSLFRDRLDQSIFRAERRDETFAVLYLDLDHFKPVNDALGHDIGDGLLVSVAERLSTCVRESDTVARLGGDEFAIILENLSSTHSASSVAEKIIEAISTPFEIDGHMLYISTSIGISVYPHCGKDAETLVKNADSAMYRTKKGGRGRYSFYTSDMNSHALDQLQMEIELRRALENEEFVLHYQPKMSLVSGKMTGTEALLRWNHPEKGLIFPEKFIPLLEKNGLIVEVGQWVIETACRQNQQWHAAGLDIGKVAVNLSGKQLMRQDFSKNVARILKRTGLNPGLLEVELTESLLIKNTSVCNEMLDALRKLGVSIAIDDFGTGYCSFIYLKQFLVNTLKIDRSFVSNVTSDGTDSAITTAMIGLARELKINVVAEGVENRGQLEYLRARQTDEIQGYLVSPPIPAESISNLVNMQDYRSRKQHEMDIPIESRVQCIPAA